MVSMAYLQDEEGHGMDGQLALTLVSLVKKVVLFSYNPSLEAREETSSFGN